MRILTKSLILSMALIVCGTAIVRADDLQPIRWVIKEGMQADQRHAERIYEAACEWIEAHVAIGRIPVKPQLIIHIGESCPDETIGRACYSPSTSDLYLPKWDRTSASAVAHASLMAGLMQLMDREKMRQAVASLLKDDSRNFVNARVVGRELD